MNPFSITNLIIVTLGLIFAAGGMTFNTIFKISDTLFLMLGGNVGGRVFVAAVAGVFSIGALMASYTINVAVAFVVEREGVVEQLGGSPRGCTVATRTICAKLPCVNDWLRVARDAVGQPCVAECDFIPVVCIVAGRTLAGIMIRGGGGGVTA